MIFHKTAIPGVVVIEPKVHGDARGYFVETFRQDLLEKELGYCVSFCQDNESKSSYGVLRGLLSASSLCPDQTGPGDQRTGP